MFFGDKKLDIIGLTSIMNNSLPEDPTSEAYRRLVNIPEEDHQRFLETVGELPTWLRLDTLLPEAAKELVRSTLTQE